MTRTKDITDFQGSDIIDVRDVIERVTELRDERDALEESYKDCESEYAGASSDADIAEKKESMEEASESLTDFNDDNGVELKALEALLDDLKGNGGDEQWDGDWYPVTLINESYFKEAMDEMLEDIGDIPKDLPCYLTITVDYDVLKTDYASTEFDGVTYWYR